MGCLEEKCCHTDYQSVISYCEKKKIKLTPLREQVLQTICRANKALTAYALLDVLQKETPSLQAMSVYRILNFLLDKALIHRIESLNAFVLCHHLNAKKHLSQWLICEQCGEVTECDLPAVQGLLDSVKNQVGFSVNSSMIELSGVCNHCQ